MTRFTAVLLTGIVLSSCTETPHISSVNPVNWEKRIVTYAPLDSMINGKTYLSVYSQVYYQSERNIYDLTATVSLRNMNERDTVFIDKASYYNTGGQLIRNYFEKTIFIAPLETIEIVIDEKDKLGGTGANFIFDWQVAPGVVEPFFESVMISTSGQQGISFTTQGKRIK